MVALTIVVSKLASTYAPVWLFDILVQHVEAVLVTSTADCSGVERVGGFTIPRSGEPPTCLIGLIEHLLDLVPGQVHRISFIFIRSYGSMGMSGK